VTGARSEEQAVVMLLGEQVAKPDGVERPAEALRLLTLRVVPLGMSTVEVYDVFVSCFR